MLYQLNWRIWLAVFLIALYPLGYMKGRSDGKNVIRNEWKAAVAQANIESFKASERRQRNLDKATTDAAVRAGNDRARSLAVAVSIDRLRNTLDATERNAATSLNAAAATVSAYRAVFESCTAEYRSLGEEASGHASDSLMYQQGWTR